MLGHVQKGAHRMLKLIDIEKNYGAARILRKVSLCCRAGEAVCLAGANAAGKTTLLTIAAGLQKPDGGNVEKSGTMGFVPQESTLLPELSVLDNLRLWYAACGASQKPFDPGSVERMLHLEPYAKKKVSRLSGGIRKRTSISCALSGSPGFLLLDEPFTALDLASRQEVAQLLCSLKERGMGILFSSHDPAAIAVVADRMVLLSEGEANEECALSGENRTEQVIRALSRVTML